MQRTVANPKPPGRRALRERAILQATLAELARSDYGALSIEQVAARAGVNKTTIYRRWPGKPELVLAAMASFVESLSPGPSSGSLRADLMLVGRQVMQVLGSVEGQSLVRLRMAGVPELRDTVSAIMGRRFEQVRELVVAAVRRGELAADVDTSMVVETFAGTLFGRVVLKHAPIDEVYIDRLIDNILTWAARPARAARGRRR